MIIFVWLSTNKAIHDIFTILFSCLIGYYKYQIYKKYHLLYLKYINDMIFLKILIFMPTLCGIMFLSHQVEIYVSLH